MASRRRRPPGTGAIYWSEQAREWRGSVEAGWTSARGTRRRITVSSATPGPARGRAECARKLERKRAGPSGRVRRRARCWRQRRSRPGLANGWRCGYELSVRRASLRIVPPSPNGSCRRLVGSGSTILTPADVRSVGEAPSDPPDVPVPQSVERMSCLIKMLKDATPRSSTKAPVFGGSCADSTSRVALSGRVQPVNGYPDGYTAWVVRASQPRQYGTGSVFWNAARGRWIGTIEAGTSARGSAAAARRR